MSKYCSVLRCFELAPCGIHTSANEAKSDVKGSWLTSVDKSGAFQRKQSSFRNSIGSEEFPAEAGRYHIYWSGACPWAHRTVIMRALKGLNDVIGLTIVDWFLDGKIGWKFNEPEPNNGFLTMRELYLQSNPEYGGNITVPVLYDKKTKRIVNNESSEIIRQLNTEFKQFSSNPALADYDYYPENLRAEIDAINEWVYPNINNGVYRCGFATSQGAYMEAFGGLFQHLDKVEEILGKSRYLTGDHFTEADIRLFTTLIRFDKVYYVHFKCNGRRIIDYPNIHNYMLEIFHLPLIHPTVLFDHIVHHYYESHKNINPHGIVPGGPFWDPNQETSDRDQKFGENSLRKALGL